MTARLSPIVAAALLRGIASTYTTGSVADTLQHIAKFLEDPLPVELKRYGEDALRDLRGAIDYELRTREWLALTCACGMPAAMHDLEGAPTCDRSIEDATIAAMHGPKAIRRGGER